MIITKVSDTARANRVIDRSIISDSSIQNEPNSFRLGKQLVRVMVKNTSESSASVTVMTSTESTEYPLLLYNVADRQTVPGTAAIPFSQTIERY
jgi:hypothetical protein